jgi:hypothetical protein
MTEQPPKRIRPQDDPEETVERLAKTRLSLQEGDILVTREAAGGPLAPSFWRYALTSVGSHDVRYFARYDYAAREGEHLAAQRRVRLLYVEDGTPAVLMDYRR